MINQLLRLGALIATGRFLKPRLKGLLWIALIWVVLWFVHSEYERYVELSDDKSFVLYASLLKLGLYALSIAAYAWLVERKLWPKAVKVPPANAKSGSPKPANKPAQHKAEPGKDDDGFDFLREKKKLRNQADELLEKNQQT